MDGQLLVILGIVLSALAVAGFLAFLVFYHKRSKALKAELDKEYGESLK